MGLCDFLIRTAVRVVVLPVAVVHDVATMGGAVNDSRCMVGDIIEDTVKDAQKTVDEVKS